MSRAPLRRLACAGVTALAAVGAVVALPSLAGAADSAAPMVTTGNWYWAETAQTTGTPVQGGLSNVPDGDYGVAYAADPNGAPDKLTALAFDLGAIPEGADVSSFTVTLVEDPAAHQLAGSTPAVVACKNTTPFQPAPGPTSIDQAPQVEAPTCVDGTFDAKTSSYTFEIGRYAADWVAGAPAYGISVRPKAGDSTPFSLAFLGALHVRTSVSYTPPPPAVTPPPSSAPPAVQPQPQPGAGAIPAADSGSAALTAVGATPARAAAAATSGVPAPQVAAQAAAPAAAAASGPLRTGRVPLGFWAAAAGLAALLVLTSLVLGGTRPVTTPLGHGRLDGLVRRRREAAGERPAATLRTV